MNLTAVNDNVAAANSVTVAYDAAQRLASARGPWGTRAYGYTPNGDRAQEVLTPPGGSALTTVLSYPVNSNRLASTRVGGVTTRTFAYDAAGNLVTQVTGQQRLAFAYNQRNRPVTVTRTGDGSQTSAYLFNALEQLVQRRTNAPGGPAGTVQYIYGLDGELLAEADAATGRTLREYIWLPQGDTSPAADNDNEEGAASLPLPLALAHVPIRWNHLIGKNMRQIISLGMILSQKWFHFCGSCPGHGRQHHPAAPDGPRRPFEPPNAS